jgi:exodeoxyribonuclease V gamma subunit
VSGAADTVGTSGRGKQRGARGLLTVHRSERADRLVDGLAELLADPPDDPFTPDVIAVPSKGVERWISQRLSSSLGAQDGRADGVCANVDFPSPRRLVADVVAVSAGVDPADDPWSERRLPWTVLGVVDACADEPWCATLGRHLGRGDDDGIDRSGRRLAVAQKLAGLFASYASQRPEMVRAWAAGDDIAGASVPLPADLRWQAELWRRVRSAIGTSSPAERIESAADRVRVEPTLVDLPARLSVFGPTRLTTDQLSMLDALAVGRDVHIWLPHPSGRLWSRLESGAPTEPVDVRRAADATAAIARHPLLRSLGRDAREMQLRLLTRVHADNDEYLQMHADDPPTKLLHRLQRDLRDDALPAADYPLSSDDSSIQVHACHGRQRQVEVLREAIVGALDDDPSLELRDIVVMCPDIEAFAPLISAAFGGLSDDDVPGAHPGHGLSVRLADRAVRQTNPVLTVLAALLDLAEARVTASEVLDLAAMPPVRRRFRLDDDALDRVGDWIREAGVRWGIDAAGRASYSLDQVRQNTWQAGLDRILLGAAMDEDGLRTVGLALPLDDVESNDVDLAGRLAELVDRLTASIEAFSRPQSPQEWSAALIAAIDSMTAVPPFDEWQQTQARWQVEDALGSTGDQQAAVELRLGDIRALLGERLRGRPTRANFRTGRLTMCTMVPMRSVPHRLVCLLGLDDGVFPRGTAVDGDDVLARSPLIGERDRRSEDRQLFLDAILAARERLIVVYTGADERTGAERPPAVPLGELLDVLDDTCAPSAEGPARATIVIRHPLQPFSPRNFTDGELGSLGPFSFDTVSLAGSHALLSKRVERPGFLASPLPQAERADVVELETLVQFFEHPARSFVRDRLELTLLRDEDEQIDDLPIELDALQRWQVGTALLAARMSGTDREHAVRAERLRGAVPPGRLGGAIVDEIAGKVDGLVAAATSLRDGAASAVDVAASLQSGQTVVGTVPSVYGTRAVRVDFSRLGAKHRVRAWIDLLALTASQPDPEWRVTTVAGGGSGHQVSTFAGVTAEAAREELDGLASVFARGQCEPLFLPVKSAYAYAHERERGRDASAADREAADAWGSKADQRRFGEYDDRFHRLIWGDSPYAELAGRPVDPSLPWRSEPHLFGQLARYVWARALASEEVGRA